MANYATVAVTSVRASPLSEPGSAAGSEPNLSLPTWLAGGLYMLIRVVGEDGCIVRGRGTFDDAVLDCVSRQ
jgi:hypothetical protein